MSSNTPTLTQPMRISVVLPTMNEAENVEQLCQRLYVLKQNHIGLMEAIFVLNNTIDGTDKVLERISERPGYDFVRVARCKGARGTAIRRGVELAQGEIVVVMDSDGQYDPGEIPKLVNPILDDGYLVVIGKNHGWASLSRRIISEVYKKLTRILIGIEYVQTGFKAGVKEILLETIPENVSGLDIDVRWMNNIVKKGYRHRISERVVVHCHRRLHGKTTFNPLMLSLGLLFTTLGLAMERRAGREPPLPRIMKELTLQPQRQAAPRRA